MKIGLWGNFGTLNLGNECTLAAAIHGLRRSAGEIDLVCICPGPQDAAVRHGIAAVEMRAPAVDSGGPEATRLAARFRRIGVQMRAWVHALHTARGLDALWIVGTGILTDDEQGRFGFPYELFKWCLVTRLTGGRVFFVSVGVEGIRQSLARMLMTSSLRMADWCSFRDELSRSRMRAAGIARRDDHVYPDLAFCLPECRPSRGASAHPGRRAVAVGIYRYCNRGHGGEVADRGYRHYLDVICSFIVWLLDHGYAVRLVIGDAAYDPDVREDVRSELQERGVALTQAAFADEPAGSYQQVLEQLASADIIVATRFHNVLLGLFLGKPVISVSYDAKNEALMQQMGLGAYCQRIDELQLVPLIDQFNELEALAPSLVVPIAQRSAAFRTALEEQFDRMLRAMDRRTVARESGWSRD